jgi:hypothetical protein
VTFYTYCGDDPHRRPERDPIPIGPVLTADSSGARQIWKRSPDTEDVRQHLLALLGGMQEQPASKYPLGTYLHEIVIWQLGEFGEMRAVERLQRVASFDPASTEAGQFERSREGLVQVAGEALSKIDRDWS